MRKTAPQKKGPITVNHEKWTRKDFKDRDVPGPTTADLMCRLRVCLRGGIVRTCFITEEHRKLIYITLSANSKLVNKTSAAEWSCLKYLQDSCRQEAVDVMQCMGLPAVWLGARAWSHPGQAPARGAGLALTS